jgi:hypothetical protein
MSTNHIDLKELLAIDGGISYIIHRYPDARESENSSKRKFKVRAEKTPSAALKRTEDGTYIVTDFGGDQKARNAVQLVQLEDGVDFVTALKTVASFYNFAGQSRPETKPGYNSWTAKPEEAEGSMEFDFREFEQYDLKHIFSVNAWNALGRTDEDRIKAAIQLCSHYHLKCLNWYTYTAKGVTHQYTSTELYPIFLWDEGDWKKLYKPKAEKQFRFQSTGKKPEHFIHGLMQSQKKFAELQAKEDETADPENPEKKRKEKKLPEIILVSGGSDALNVAALGYRVVWMNSETAQLRPVDYKALALIADVVYNLPDIDNTGIREAHKLALEFLAIRTIWLPCELKKNLDGRGFPCKDVRDFLKYYRKFDFVELIKIAIPYQFWDEQIDRDKDGEIRFMFGKPVVKYVFNNVHAYNFLNRNGYARFRSVKEKDGYKFVKVANNIVSTIESAAVKDFMHGFLETRRMPIDLRNTIYKTPQLGDTSLANIGIFDGDFKTYGPDFQYMFFQKTAWKITAQGITEEKAGTIDKYIWESKVIQHNAKPLPDMFKISRLADGGWDIQITDPSCMFFKFLIQTCRIHWRKELEERLNLCEMTDKARAEYVEKYGFSPDDVKVMMATDTAEKQDAYKKEFAFSIDGGLLLPEEIAEQKLHLVNRIFAIGYALHRYKDPAKPWAVFAMDNKLSEEGESHGGAGTGLVAKALYKLLNKVQLDGRNPKLTENPHVFENIDSDTDLIHVEDANEYLNFGFFFAPLTSAMTVNPKQKRSFEISFEESPKFWFDTNYGDRMTDPSSLRRKLYTVFGDYYHENNGDYKESRTPTDDFGRSLFTDFTDDDWNFFYNFMAQCLRFFLSTDEKITPPMNNVSKRNLMSEMGDHFRNWADVYFSPESGRLDTLVIREEAFEDFTRITKLKTYTAQRFSKALKAWSRFNGYILNPLELQNSQGRIIRRPVDKTPKEMIYVRQPGKEINEL